MPQRLPDEFFRAPVEEPPAEQLEDAPASPPTPRRIPQPSRLPKLAWRAKGISIRWLIAGIVAGFVVGLGVGALFKAPHAVKVPSSTHSPGTKHSETSKNVPYDGPVKVVIANSVTGSCEGGTGHDVPRNLIDGDPATIWRCAGTGTNATLTFTLDRGVRVVGMRVVNGNTTEQDRYLQERRLSSVKWTFDDGSWLIQGFAPNDPAPQEVRIPPVAVTGPVQLSIQTSTPAGESSAVYDAVAISQLEFLVEP